MSREPKFHIETHTKGYGRVSTVLPVDSDRYETAIFWPNGDIDIVAHYDTQEKAEFGHAVYSTAMRRHELTQDNIHNFDPVF